MADYGRALIAGDPTTFGKGTVQLPRDLAAFMPYFSRQEGCGLIKVTTQKFYRIGGASTQLKGVASDIVIPSVTQGFRIGEGEQDYVLPYDEIPSAGGYVKSDRIARILPDILKKSQARMKQDKDLQYYQEDADRADKRYEENSISLNKQKRQDENNTLLERKKAIDAERKVRYEKMAKQDEKDLVIYRLKRDDISYRSVAYIICFRKHSGKSHYLFTGRDLTCPEGSSGSGNKRIVIFLNVFVLIEKTGRRQYDFAVFIKDPDFRNVDIIEVFNVFLRS